MVRGRDRGVTRRYWRDVLAVGLSRDGLDRVGGVRSSFFLGGLPLLEDLGGLPRGLDGTTTSVLLGRPRVLGGEAAGGDTAVAAGGGDEVPALQALFLAE